MGEKVLYAIPTHRCNLSCPHCTIKDADEKYDHIAFMSALNNFDGRIILFGGEPTVNRERMMSIFRSQEHNAVVSKIGSISTNLIVLDDELIELYKKIKYVATSWNRTRFTDNEYKIWKNHLRRLGEAGVKPGILITLTDDLIDDDPEDFLKVVDEWPSDCISWIRFEHLIDDANDKSYYEAADSWLCDVYKHWRSPIRVQTFDKDLKWYHDCRNVYTLEPDGTMHNVCPNGLYVKARVPKKCLMCEKSKECMPCRLHSYCSYPKKLRELIEADKS